MKWFTSLSDVKRTTYDRAAWLFKKAPNGYVFLGEVALECGFGINQTSTLLDVLSAEGLIRRLFPEEVLVACLHPNADVWMSTGKTW